MSRVSSRRFSFHVGQAPNLEVVAPRGLTIAFVRSNRQLKWTSAGGFRKLLDPKTSNMPH